MKDFLITVSIMFVIAAAAIVLTYLISYFFDQGEDDET